VNTIEINSDIRARQKASGVWELKHPGQDGRMTDWYSSGIKGSERELRSHVKQTKLEDIVVLGKNGALSERVIAQFQRGTPKRITLESVRDEWQDWMEKVGKAPRSIETCLNNFDRWIKTQKIQRKNPMHVTVDDIYPFVNPVDSPIKIKTRSIRLFAIRTLFEYLVAHNYSAGNPSAIVKVRKDKSLVGHSQQEVKRIEAFTKAEYNKLIKYFDREIAHVQAMLRGQKKDPGIRKPVTRLNWLQFFRFATVFSYEIGLRLGDICQLEWLSFSEVGEVIVHTDKSDTRIAVPMSDDMQAALELVPTDDMDYLFPMQRELILSKKRSQVSVYFKNELDRCEIEGKSFHALRHTCIRRMRKELKDEYGDEITADEVLERIGRVVAHANTSTTKGYL